MGLDKTTAVVAIVLLLLSGAILVATQTVHQNSDREINVISRVNEEGSMLVIRENDDPNNYLSVDAQGVITIDESQRGNWEKMVVGTPGMTTIQHKMMESFVSLPYSEVYIPDKTGLGMKFLPYRQDGRLEENTVYYDTTFTNKTVWDNDKYKTFVDAGIIWEPVCSSIVYGSEKTGKILLNTNQMSPGHACCVIAGSHSYLSDHNDTVIRFLAAYVKSVDEMKKIISNGSSDPKYSELIDFIKTKTKINDDIVVENALKNITYTYGNDNEKFDSLDAPLTSLRNDVVKFAKQSNLIDMIKKMGYVGTDEQILSDYANTIVNDKYLAAALNNKEVIMRDANINVACIEGDIHQIALQFGKEKTEFFKEQQITVDISYAANGAGVATSIQNGAVNIGFMGVPPITMVTVNSALNPMKTYELSGTLQDKNGNALSNVEFRINAYGHTYQGLKTEDNGSFKLDVLNGTFAVDDKIPIIEANIDGKWVAIDLHLIERIDDNFNLGTLKVEGDT